MTSRTRKISIANSAIWLSCSAGFTPHEPFSLMFLFYICFWSLYCQGVVCGSNTGNSMTK
ncbi:hypothetical protein BDV33DRAFT_166822 [Aspergillus novoparasiticus]|uniref:Uncharacterized protein n=1 Tax=Aspergillus novoparasiticus TaxID=986946 RepID=A0A5N6F1E1_9EURO|nr:hypothetical protein BDV33DRAFT_166822 [Aspergillus novoparasiticus]